MLSVFEGKNRKSISTAYTTQIRANVPPPFSGRVPFHRGFCRTHKPLPRPKKARTCKTASCSAWTILMTVYDYRSSFQPGLSYQSLMLARYVSILQGYLFIILYLPVFVLPFSPETRKKEILPLSGNISSLEYSILKTCTIVPSKITVPDGIL